MGRSTYIGFVAYLLVGSIDLSQQYGTKGGHHSFSQSYSTSSASAQSSSFSSSGSYSFGDKSVLPIIGSIPIAKATAVDSASAGAATAVSGASASADAASAITSGSANTGVDGIKKSAVGSTFAAGGLGSYGSDSGDGQSQIGSYGGTKPSSHISSLGNSQIGLGSYGSASHNGAISSSVGTYGSQSASSHPGSYGKEKESEDNGVLMVPCCKPIPPGPNGSIFDYKIPSKVNTITGTTTGNVQGGSYGGSKPSASIPSNSGSYGTTSIGTQVISSGASSGSYAGAKPQNPAAGATPGQKPCCKGPFPGPNGSIYDSKPATAVGTAVKPSGSQEPIKPTLPLHRPQVNFPGPSGSIYTSKPVNTGTSGSYSPGSASHTKPLVGYQQPSAPGGSFTSTSTTVVKPIGGYSPSGSQYVPQKPIGGVDGQYGFQGNMNTASSSAGSFQTQYQGTVGYKPSCGQGGCNKEPTGISGSYNKPAESYQPSGPAVVPSVTQQLPIVPSVSSNTVVQPVGGYTPSGPNSVPSKPIGNHGYQSNSKVVTASTDSHQIQYQETIGYKPSCSQGGCSKEPSDKPGSSLYNQSAGNYQASGTGNLPGSSPTSSHTIGEYSPSAPQSVSSKPIGGQIQHGYHSTTNVASTGADAHQIQYQGTVGYKPSCNQGGCSHGTSGKPSSSIYNQPAESYQPSLPAKIPNGSQKLPGFPSVSSNTVVEPVTGYKPSISAEPLGETQGQYGYHSTTNAASSGANSYQTQYQGTVGYKPSCTQGSCPKEPPRTYLQPPQGQEKPVVEPGQEQYIPSSSLGVVKPQIQTTVTAFKPGTSGVQISSVDSSYITGKVTPVPATSVYEHGQSGSGVGSYGKPVGPHQATVTIEKIKPVPGTSGYGTTATVGGIQKEGAGAYGGSFSASGASSSSTAYSTSGGVVGIHKTTGPSVTVIDDQRKEDDGKILYVSGPGSPNYNVGGSSVTENTIIGGGLHEGSRGSPLVPKDDVKGSSYDDSGESAIIFFDGQKGSGGYSSGGAVYSGSSGSNVVYSGSKYTGGKPTGSSVSTIVVDLSKPGTSGEGIMVGGSESSGGVVVVGTSGDASKSGVSGSYGYVGSSIGHKGIPCTSSGCGSTYRGYSNAIPSKNFEVHITAVPSGSGGSYGGGKIGGGYGGVVSKGGSYGASSGGSYSGSSAGSYGSSSAGSYGAASAGSYGGSSASTGNGGDGFLSFLGDGGEASVGAHTKGGSYSHSSSFAKSSSFASSSSFSSASSGSYSSGHY